MKPIFPIAYFPPISYFTEIVKYDEVILENAENFIKQTYRNRCEIVSANGRLSLIIPIEHSGNRLMKDIKISSAVDWQKNHLRSIHTAYQCSPFFEYYEDHFINLYEKKYSFLIDFTLESTKLCFDIFKLPFKYEFSNAYSTEYEADFRAEFNPKNNQTKENTEYIQVFADRMPFQKDVSALDLICNIGTKCATYLKS